MTKMLEMACSSGSRGGSCPRVGLTTGVLDATSEATSRGDASLVKMYEVGLLKTLSLYRELVDIEVRRASEHGARWWSRRLVEMSEEAGLVRLDK